MLRFTRVALLLLVLLPAAVWAMEPLNSPRPVTTIRKLPQSGVAMEDLAPYLFSMPANIERFDFVRRCRTPKQRTQVTLSYDDDNLYVAFRCFERDLSKLVIARTTRDASLWKDDSVFVTVDPDRNPDTYVRLGAGAGGAQYDERDRKFVRSEWNGRWDVTVAREGDSWTAVMSIPFKTLGVAAPRPGDVWGANFQRYFGGREESTFWSPVRVDISEAERCGKVVFGARDALVASVVVPKINSPGEQMFSVQLSNPTDKSIPLVADFINDGKIFKTLKIGAIPEDSGFIMPVDYPFDGWHELNIRVSDTKGKVVAMSPASLVRLASYRTDIQRFQQMTSALKPTSDEKKKAVADLDTLLTDLASKKAPTKEKWDALGPKVAKAEQETERVRALCADTADTGYAVGIDTALTKILRDKLFGGSFGQPLRLSLARNEFESGQVVVLAHGKKLEKVQVSATDLVGPNGVRIPAADVALNVVGYVETRIPAYEIEYIGWWPDPLMDNDPFDVEQGKHQPVWVTVHMPTGVPAGLYKGQVTIAPSNAPAQTVPLEVTVWNFDVPTRTHMRTAFAMFPYELGGWYGKRTDQMEQDYEAFLLEHHISPCNIYSKEPLVDFRRLDWYLERGLNSIHLGNINALDDERIADLLSQFSSYKNSLLAKDAWKYAYMYGFDELGPDKYADLRKTWGAIGQKFPELPRMTTVVPNPDLKGYVDIWVPLTGDYKASYTRDYAKNGDAVWWYVCCDPFHPYPNFFVDYPAIDPRILFWMNWKYNVPGVLYYAINLWDTNYNSKADGNLHYDKNVVAQMEQGKRWPDIPWNSYTCASFNGDGHLIYPGRNGKPWSSIRFEAIRDGIDDYEYFYMLNSAVAAAQKNKKTDKALLARASDVLKVRANVVKSLTEYTKDPQELYDARREVAELIVKLKQANRG